MNHWHKYPFIRLIIPFILGIILAKSHLNDLYTTSSIFLFLFTILIITGVKRKLFSAYKNRWIYGILLNMFLLISGLFLARLHQDHLRIEKNSLKEASAGFFICDISRPGAKKTNSVQYKARVKAFKNDNKNWQKANGDILVYFDKESLDLPAYGERIIFKSKLQQIEPPGNPYEFDYKGYLAERGIFHQTYIRKNDFRVIDSGKGNPLLKISFMLRNNFLDLLKAHGLQGEEFQIASAILAGKDDELDRQLRSNYAGAGAMHILCVSGLHVGIIYLFFGFMLNGLKKLKHGRYIRAVLLLLIIWFYAMITGMAPSVLRAATMFSFVVIGSTFERQTNIYNTLAASAFFLLMIKPAMLNEIGFQLSYAAVFAIVWIQPFLDKLLVFENKLLRYFWGILTVSVAAQLGTFPIALFYFHQFPNYFFLTNLLVIPLSFLIVSGGLIMVLFSWWPLLSSGVAFLLDKLVFSLNFSVELISSLPEAVSKQILLNLFELIMIYLIIALSVHVLKNKKFKLIKYALLLLIVFFIERSVIRSVQLKQTKFFVYDIRNHLAMEYMQGRHSVFIADSMLMRNDQTIEYHIHGNRTANGIRQTTNLIWPADTLLNGVLIKSPFFMVENKTGFVLSKKSSKHVNQNQLNVNILIYSRNPYAELPKINSSLRQQNIISASTNSVFFDKRLRKAADSLIIPVHFTRQNGAFVLKF